MSLYSLAAVDMCNGEIDLQHILKTDYDNDRVFQMNGPSYHLVHLGNYHMFIKGISWLLSTISLSALLQGLLVASSRSQVASWPIADSVAGCRFSCRFEL